ncbi:thioesterase family protein [Spirulina sp. CS-785/01]|uniref:acyl-CoA thioesterase n=1 Tax=Spirulina sp. CS-785/01 TaxID=3021716 RepID=UPI00232BB65D|nr:thioesterase family protein [Spirulina sp. CS-785/01]MDB9312480.1 thioesterase family protein [Spirulina sp. CS-785/01]
MGDQQNQLPPTRAITEEEALQAKTESWYEYLVKAQPHHTDYAGIVWHGTYISWLEEARVECLRSIGIDFADLVKIGCDLPVVDLSVRYHQALRLGETAVLKARMRDMSGVRIVWDYELRSPHLPNPETPPQDILYLTAQVTLVAVDREKGKIMRRLPPSVKNALVKLSR